MKEDGSLSDRIDALNMEIEKLKMRPISSGGAEIDYDRLVSQE